MTKILLVEDDKSLREIYGVRLLAEGYDIVSAGDGEAALAMAIKDRPSLIVSDVMMPKISGFDMLDILRSTTETKDIKVIMMTALSSDDQRKRGEQLGADKYLVKSQVGIEDVVRAVHEVLGDGPLTSASTAPVFPSSSSIPASPMPASQPAPSFATPAVAPQPAAPQQTAPVFQTPSDTPPALETPSTLPQPTAPFSTARPGNLGSRIIQPIERNEPTPAIIADQIEKELGSINTAPAPVSDPNPAPTPSPAAVPPAPSPIAPTPAQPASAPLETSSTPQPAPFNPTVPVMSPPAPVTTPITDPITTPSISYEETPPQRPQQTL